MAAHHHLWCVGIALSIEVASCALWSFGGLLVLGGTLWLEWIAVTAAEPWHYQMPVYRKELLREHVVPIHNEWLRGTKCIT